MLVVFALLFECLFFSLCFGLIGGLTSLFVFNLFGSVVSFLRFLLVAWWVVWDFVCFMICGVVWI